VARLRGRGEILVIGCVDDDGRCEEGGNLVIGPVEVSCMKWTLKGGDSEGCVMVARLWRKHGEAEDEVRLVLSERDEVRCGVGLYSMLDAVSP